MKICKVAFSNEAPSMRDCLWAKPVSGGFVLYMLNSGTWVPMKIVSDGGTAIVSDDTYTTASDYAPALKSGTFAKKPSNPKAGDSYFCTNKTTSATNAENGIMIYYNGTHWVDATGVVVS